MVRSAVALDNQQWHRTIAVNLHHERAIELQIGRKQRAGCNQLAQHAHHGLRIIVVLSHLAPGRIERDDFASNRRSTRILTVEQKLVKRIAHE